MKICKYLHSCLLFEDEGFKLLIDPGNITFAEELVNPELFSDVNAIIITHTHPDHLDMENLKVIAELSGAPIHTNTQVGEKIGSEGLEFILMEEGVFEIGPFKVKAFPVQHQPLLDAPIPQMTGLVINDKVLHAVDSFDTKLVKYKGIEVLIMVTMAPFANELQIAEFADSILPKQIFPVHDGYCKEFFVNLRYNNYEKHFDKLGVKFHRVIKPGDGIEI